MSKLEIRQYRSKWSYDDYYQFGGNFIDSRITPGSYPPQCKACKQQHESTQWREDVDKVLCDECYAKEKEDGKEKS